MSNNTITAGIEINAEVNNLNALNNLIDELEQAGNNVDELRQRSVALGNEWDNLSPSEQAQQFSRLRESVQSVTDETEQQTGAWQRLRNFMRNTRREMRATDSTSSRLERRLKQLALGFGAYLSARTITKFFTSAISGAASLEEQLDKVQAVSGATATEMAKIKTVAEELGASTRYTATQAAEGFEILARAGLNAEEQIQTIPNVLALAQGQSIEMAEAAGFVADAVGVMGGSFAESGRYVDVLAKGASQANTTVPQLANAISYAGQYAKEAGMDIEQLVGVLDLLAKNGVRGERAGTALRNIFAQLQDPASTASKELSKLGIETDSLSSVIDGLASAGDSGKVAINAFGTEAGPALRALLKGGNSGIDGFTKNLNDASGAADEAAKKMDGNLKGAIRGLSSAWAAVENKFASPMLKPLTEKIRKLIGTLREFSESPELAKLGEYFADLFSGMLQNVIDFVRGFSLDEVTGKVDAFAAPFIEKMNAVGNAFDLVVGVFGAGINTIRASIELLFGSVAKVNSALVGFGASIADALGMDGVAETLNKTSDAYNMFADTALENASASLDKATQKANQARDGFMGLSGAVKDNTEAISASALVYNNQLNHLDGLKQKLDEVKQTEDALAAGAKRNSAEHNAVTAERINLEMRLAETQDDLIERKKALVLTEVQSIASFKKGAEATKESTKATKEAITAEQQLAEARSQSLAVAKTAFESLGVDVNKSMTGISASAQTALDAFDTGFKAIEKSGTDSTKVVEDAITGMLSKLSSPEEFAAAKQQLQDLGASANMNADQQKRLAEGQKTSQTEAKVATEQNTQAVKNQTQAVDETNTATDESAESLGALADVGGKSGSAIANLTQKYTNLFAESKTATKAFKDGMSAFWVGNDMGDFLEHIQDVAKGAQQELDRYNDELTKVATSTETLSQKTSDGTLTMQDLKNAAGTANVAINYLDEAQLNGLNSAIQAAENKLKSLEETAKSTAKSIRDRLLDATQTDEEKIERKYNNEIDGLNEKQSGAGSDKERGYYAQAIADLQKLKNQELKKQRQQAQKAREQATPSAPVDVARFEQSLQNHRQSQPALDTEKVSEQLAESFVKHIDSAKKEAVQETVSAIKNSLDKYKKGKGK